VNHPLGDPLPGVGALDDNVTILRDSRLLFQRRLTEIARRAGVALPAVVEAFTQASGEAYDELVAAKRDGFEQTQGLTASRITLMCDNDLEYDIRIGEIVRRLDVAGGRALWRTQLRYSSLLGRLDMSPTDNPVGPDAIGRGLWAICRASNVGLEDNFDMLAAIEVQLGEELPNLYSELNDLLAGRKVELAQTRNVSGGGTRQTVAKDPSVLAPAGVAAGPNLLPELQSLLMQQMAGGHMAGGQIAGGERTGGQGTGSGPAPGYREAPNGNVALNAATLVMLNQLASRLDRLELSGIGKGLEDTLRQPEPEPGTQPRSFRAKDLGLELGKPESVVLDTLAHIFDAIFASSDLPETVRAAVGRLQVPLLKLALFDSTLFSDTDHPARQLINGLARAALGLPRLVSPAHPVCARVWKIANQVCATLQRDSSVLKAPLVELAALIVERDQAVQAAAQPYLALLGELEAREQAAWRWLELIEASNPAPEILAFLRRYWVHVMQAAYGEGGEVGRRWQENHNTIVDLLWSVQPKESSDERKTLVRLVPTLLKRLASGLDLCGISPEERTLFVDACFTLQTAALRGEAKETTPPLAGLPGTDVEPVSELSAGIVDCIDSVDIDGQRLKVMRLALRSPSPGVPPESGVQVVQVGDWLQFDGQGCVPGCGLVCGLSPQSGSVLLFNPDWDSAMVLAFDLLEQQRRDLRARVVSSEAIFDIAAECAIRQLGGA
jgi:hypothetical protein